MGNCGGGKGGLSLLLAYGKLHETARVRETFMLYKTAAKVKVGSACFSVWKTARNRPRAQNFHALQNCGGSEGGLSLLLAYGKLHETARVRRTFMLYKTAAEVKMGSAHSISGKERACFV